MELEVKTLEKKYPILIQRDGLNKIRSHFESGYKVLILSDDGVPFIYVERLKKQLKKAEILIISQGETNKSFNTYQTIINHLMKLNFTKKDYIVTLGGGMVLDLGGFVAATYKRGMRWVSIPTTSLAMVDASIGGKVAINHMDIKNSVGTYYHPEVVIVDPTTLETLPKRHFINGIIEALKTGIIGDRELYSIFFEKDYKERIDEIIYKSLKFKAKIVEADEKENRLRKILNFGHTFGHAYEAYFSMKDYLHGEAVALGMLTVSKGESYYQELKNLFKKWKIKTEINVDANKILNLIFNDKKMNKTSIDLIKVKEIGSAEIIETEIGDLKKYLEEI